MQENPTSNNKLDISNNDELVFKFIIKFFIRNKVFIGYISFLFFIISCLFSFTLRKVWEGDFQIVMKKEMSKNPIDLNSSFANLIDLEQENDLKTQVGILESPSILRPIYKEVISNKKKNNKRFKENYLKWRKDLTIELQKNTSILNISYRDKDQKLIIPILNKMTLAYQEYSGRSKRRSQKLLKNYLKEQVTKFKEQSSLSLKNVQDFAISEDLNYSLLSNNNSFPVEEDNLDFNTSLALPNIGIENIRVNAANQIRKINIQLSKIEDLNDSDDLQYLGSTIPALIREGLPQILKDIEQDLVLMRSKYTEKDINIINLLQRRELTIELLKERSIKYLKASRLEYEALMESAMRPKGVLLKYKELIRNAERDESTLISLENQLRLIELEEAKKDDPWELITKPTLKQFPVAPSKKTIGLFGLIFGFTLATLISFVKEKKSDKVYEIEEVEKLFETSVVEKILQNEIDSSSDKLSFIISAFDLKKYKDVFLIPLEKINAKYEKFKDVIDKKLSKNQNCNLIDLVNSKNLEFSDNLFLLISSEHLSYSEIKKFKDKLNILNIKLKGIIIIN